MRGFGAGRGPRCREHGPRVVDGNAMVGRRGCGHADGSPMGYYSIGVFGRACAPAHVRVRTHE